MTADETRRSRTRAIARGGGGDLFLRSISSSGVVDGGRKESRFGVGGRLHRWCGVPDLQSAVSGGGGRGERERKRRRPTCKGKKRRVEREGALPVLLLTRKDPFFTPSLWEREEEGYH